MLITLVIGLCALAFAQDKVTIVHWQHHYPAREAVVKQLITEFEQLHPNVTIDFQSIPYGEYFQKIGPSLEAGTGPDVFQLPGPQVYEFYARDQLTPVPDDVYTAAEIEADFVPWTVELLKQDGGYVGLPTDVQLFLLFYNDALFEAAGLDPTKDFASLDELEAAARQLTVKTGGRLSQAGISLTYSPYQWYWNYLTTLHDAGSVDEATLEVTYDDAAGIDFWRWFTGLITNDGVDDPEFLTGQDKFAVGLAAMDLHEFTYAGNLAQLNPDMTYSVHLPPPAPGRPEGTAGTHWAYVVSSQSDKATAAWEWVKFLTSEEAQRQWVADGGELPSRVALYDDAELRSDPNAAVALDAMSTAVPYDAIGWDDVYGIQQGIWENIVLRGDTVESAVAAGAAAEEALYQEKQR
ncbi:MAG: extracellular solute-binding protein [Trueperaceae bacterium]|nr:extracellular solute-binding protein [Trueperaceae bacterium]MCW5819667.1 extracellular solute-binding protein [Trueperaceae bacterium]